MVGSNIKAAPDALTPDLVADFIAWLDRDLSRSSIGVDLANGPDTHAEVVMIDGRIVAIEERR